MRRSPHSKAGAATKGGPFTTSNGRALVPAVLAVGLVWWFCYVQNGKASVLVDMTTFSHGAVRVRKSDPRCERAIESLVKERIRLVAFDFDLTIVDIHTEGRWRKSVPELREHVRPEVLCLIRACNKRGINVAVATFSAQNDLLHEVLHEALQTSTDNEKYDIPIYGGLDRFAPHWLGKQSQLILARRYFDEKKGGDGVADLLVSETVLVDDDQRNIDIAQRDGYRTVFYNPDKNYAENALVLGKERRRLWYHRDIEHINKNGLV